MFLLVHRRHLNPVFKSEKAMAKFHEFFFVFFNLLTTIFQLFADHQRVCTIVLLELEQLKRAGIHDVSGSKFQIKSCVDTRWYYLKSVSVFFFFTICYWDQILKSITSQSE